MKVDCHVHFVLDGTNWKAAIGRHKNGPDREYLKTVLCRYRDTGYGYLRDGGDRWGVGFAVKEMAEEYEIRFRTPGAPLCHKGHYGGFIGKKYESMAEFAALVRENRKEGGDFLKIMISGLMDFDRCGVLTEEGLSPKEIREVIHIGKDMGCAVMVHANGARTVEAAAAAGADSVEHGAYLDRDALTAMAENGTVWVPTLSAVGNLLGKGRFDEEQVRRILETFEKNLTAFASMGGLIACGSDAGAWAVPHAADTEIDWLRRILGEQADRLLQRGNAEICRRF